MRISRAVISTIAFALLSAPALGLTKTELRSAPVPSACTHPAGQLVNGVLPGVPEGQGGVVLDERTIALGRVVPGGGIGAAAALSCSLGGVSWPQVLVFYNAKKKLVGHADLYKVTRGGRESVRRITVNNGVITVQVIAIGQNGDAACCGTASALATFRWDGTKRRVTLRKVQRFTDLKAARAFIAAIRRGNTSAARRYASSPIVSTAMSSPLRSTFKVNRCIGEISEGYTTPWWAAPGVERFCYVSAASGGSRFVFLGLHMGKVRWNAWKVRSLTWYAG